MLLADRFFRGRDGWLDVATGETVLLSVDPAGSVRQQIAWAERCAMLSVLRHPMLNPLIDYGVADPATLFEAYAPRPPVRTTAAAASRLVRHASRFLHAHGVAVPVRSADLLFRAIRIGRPPARGRFLGWVLQPRRAVDTLAELFAAPVRRGVTPVALCGPPGAGLRTARQLLAMAARRDGYVPVSTTVVCRWPWLCDELAGRHVCLLRAAEASADEHAAAAALIARLGLRSARAHVCITIGHREESTGDTVYLEPMGITSMTTMVYVDPECGPRAADVFEAARRAEGLPGAFLARLGVSSVDRPPAAGFTVHESTAAYGPGPGLPGSPHVARSRIGSVLRRARGRAAALERAGRGAVARRLLRRAARVLEARGDPTEAAGAGEPSHGRRARRVWWREPRSMQRRHGARMRLPQARLRLGTSSQSAGRTSAG